MVAINTMTSQPPAQIPSSAIVLTAEDFWELIRKEQAKDPTLKGRVKSMMEVHKKSPEEVASMFGFCQVGGEISLKPVITRDGMKLENILQSAKIQFKAHYEYEMIYCGPLHTALKDFRERHNLLSVERGRGLHDLVRWGGAQVYRKATATEVDEYRKIWLGLYLDWSSNEELYVEEKR